MKLLGLFLASLLLPVRCTQFTKDDVWSGKVWDKVQEIRSKHASNSDRLMMHIWQRPDEAHKFIDCDILADSNSEKFFMYRNHYDMDDKREAVIADLPADKFVINPWPFDEIENAATVYYDSSSVKSESDLATLRKTFTSWTYKSSVKFKNITKGTTKHNILHIVEDGGCYATLGYHPQEKRILSLVPGRCTPLVIKHLIGHVLGLPHPTSAVGYSQDYYLMAHLASWRTFGMVNSRLGHDLYAFDEMMLDPWFCAVTNRSTWRLRSPSMYQYTSIEGQWKVKPFFTPSVMTLKKAYRHQAYIDQCKKGGHESISKCDKMCNTAVFSLCTCPKDILRIPQDKRREQLPAKHKCFEKDIYLALTNNGEKFVTLSSLAAGEDKQFCTFFHSQEIPVPVKLRESIKCWQCAVTSFKISAGAIFGDGWETGGNKQLYTPKQVSQFQLIALGSRCTLFSLEMNGALEEAWYRACLHNLLDSGGEMRLAWRGPGTVLMRYYSSHGFPEFEEFNKAMLDQMMLSWTVGPADGCTCDGGPEAEMQHSRARP